MQHTKNEATTYDDDDDDDGLYFKTMSIKLRKPVGSSHQYHTSVHCTNSRLVAVFFFPENSPWIMRDTLSEQLGCLWAWHAHLPD